MLKFLREPLVHFLAIGAALFILFFAVKDDQVADETTIVITREMQERLRAGFNGTWMRQPTDAEFARLLQSHLREEVLYREALRLGLDRDDTIIRRRLNQKMEFFAASGAELLEPTEEDLQRQLNGNPEQYSVPGQAAFQQIYLGEAPTTHDIEIARTVAMRLPPEADPPAIGRPSMLPADVPLTYAPGISNLFGEAFSAAVLAAEPGHWLGPIRSAYGEHLVFVTEVVPARLPAVAEARGQLIRDWQQSRANELLDRQYEQLRSQYRIEIEDRAVP